MADKMKDTKHMCDINDMVCPDENNEVETSITVHDMTPGTTQKKISFVVRPTLAVSDIFTYVDTQYPYMIYDLSLQPETSDKEPKLIYLNNKKDKPLADIPGFNAGTKNTVVLSQVTWDVDGGVGVVPSRSVKKVDLDSTISPLTPELDMLSEDEDLGLGASASPVEPNSASTIPIAPALPMFDPIEPAHGSYKPFKIYSPPRPAGGYVGLVNQAMTCYLNSLLQALFMTPEFRNALYKWEFDNIEEAKSIPYQLQKLFLNLQTSPKVAVETTDLTRSFGWDSTEAWQQHDIQELCRVMFDALERKFKDTEQANLINNLYEGKMIDYVKCLDCCTEKSREDTFLDIPLPVRPFSSLVAYGSIEEALRAFVQPETLDGNNQYFCEKCNKKCDAHKGLKFKTFPYILTLHLKRFDFDYQTLHRIKLNDKVTFPQTLNLNSFVNVTDAGTFANLQNNNHAQTNGFASSASSEHDANESTAKYDDCSTTDSGAALEDDNSSGIATTASSSHHENELQEDDEGIDMSTNTENRSHASNESGPYLYELFAIMIHSGSASGGHYYAYIKDFESGEWYCFNDQTVSTITQEDIQKSFGGGSFKAYYSGVYSSSTNAYMLMYRQIEPKRNERAIKADEFPEHIQTLLQKLHDKDEEDKRVRASEPEFIKLKVFFCNPKLKKLKVIKAFISKSHPFKDALETAHSVLNMQDFAPISRCRLVAYDHQSKEIGRSFEGMENESVGNILKILQPTDFLLEVRGENEEFEVYEPGTVTMKVFKVDMKTYDVDGPFLIRVVLTMSVPDFKKLLAKKLDLKDGNITVVSSTICSGILVLRNSNNLYPRSKIFVACDSKPVEETEEGLKRIAEESFIHINYFYLLVPPTDKETLEILNIPKYESKVGYDESNYQTPKQSPSEFKSFGMTDVVDAVMINGTVNGEQGSGDFLRTSPVLVSMGHESNSEDSSLSDGDRTLVEIPRHDSSQMSSTSQSPQLSSPEDENGEKHGPMLPHDVASDDEVEMEIDSELYFRAVEVNEADITPYILTNGNISDSEDSKEKSQPHKTLKLIVDKRMKIGSLKRALEPLIGVPAEYFKIVRKQSDSLKLECTNLSENLITFKEGEQLRIELGRNLKKGEYKAKIHYLKLSELNDEVGKLSVICDWIFKVGMPITDAKKELVAQLHKVDPKYKSLTVENCRLWEKSGRNPVKIFSDDQQMGSDMRLSMNYEMIVQECENGVSTSTNEESLTIFVRRWRPSTLELGPFEEITLEKNDEIKMVLSSISDIPVHKVSYSKVNNCVFPCTNISLLTIQSSMQWYTNVATTENYPLNTTQNGSVYFYKNSSELPKDLTADERRELSQKEKARIERIGGASTSFYSPRKERALKIYLEK